MLPELKDKLDLAGLLFQKAEKKMKYIELLGEGLSIPAINELRYAGCHIARAWADHQDEQKALEEVDRAIKHVKRANYDASEIGILYYLENLRQFQEDYRLVDIPSSFPKYYELCSFGEDVKEKVLSNEKDSRGELWESFWNQFLTMEANFKNLKHASVELNKKLEAKNQSENRHRQIMAVSIAAIFVTLAIWLITSISPVNITTRSEADTISTSATPSQ